jgi:hypothetical protein
MMNVPAEYGGNTLKWEGRANGNGGCERVWQKFAFPRLGFGGTAGPGDPGRVCVLHTEWVWTLMTGTTSP